MILFLVEYDVKHVMITAMWHEIIMHLVFMRCFNSTQFQVNLPDLIYD